MAAAASRTAVIMLHRPAGCTAFERHRFDMCPPNTSAHFFSLSIRSGASNSDWNVTWRSTCCRAAEEVCASRDERESCFRYWFASRWLSLLLSSQVIATSSHRWQMMMFTDTAKNTMNFISNEIPKTRSGHHDVPRCGSKKFRTHFILLSRVIPPDCRVIPPPNDTLPTHTQ